MEEHATNQSRLRGMPRPYRGDHATRFDPKKHRRRSIRLPGYDYTSPGIYFVTICVRGGECLLGEVVDGQMQLNDWGRVAGHYWQRIPLHFPSVTLDEWVLMPNHIHGLIVILDDPRGRGEASPASVCSENSTGTDRTLRQGESAVRDASPLQMPGGTPPGSLGAIVGNYKSVTTRRINRMRRMPGAPFWQRNYWEHIVRNESSLNRIRVYIQGNPIRWREDQLHPRAAPNKFNRFASG